MNEEITFRVQPNLTKKIKFKLKPIIDMSVTTTEVHASGRVIYNLQNETVALMD